MKKINKILLELYKDKNQILFLYVLFVFAEWIDSFIPKNPHVIEAVGIAAAIVVGAVIGGVVTSSQGKKNREQAQDMADDAAAVAAAMEAKLEKQRQVYRGMKFTNPYAGIENYFADMENAFEDITINQQQAQFQGQQGAQQRANIMQGLRGAAGASGIAGLAQTLANQGALQAQQMSASIGAQESKNQAVTAQAAQQMDVMERQGASAANMAERGGEGMLQQMEMDRQATLLGIAQASSAGANAGLQQAYSNQMAASAASSAATAQAWGAVGSSLGSAAMAYGGGGTSVTPGYSGTGAGGPTAAQISDRRLKKNINLIGESSSGLNIYSFKYIDNKHGEGTYQGVMSDEIPSYAVSVSPDGYDHVDYSKIDVNFKQI